MKITLTKEQRDELLRNAQAEQQKAYDAYVQARDTYNKVIGLGSTVDIAELHSLVAGLPDKPAPVQPTTTTYPGLTKRFFAYSRSGRREPNGAASIHNIAVTGSTASNAQVTCSCPGFLNHGYCWASTEAKAQAFNASRKDGTGGVWKRM